MKINIVYYIFINPDRDWKIIVNGQINDLKISKLNFEKLYVHICCEQRSLNNERSLNDERSLNEVSLIEDCKKLINKVTLNVVYSESYLNQYEYPGLKLLYDLCQTEKDSIFLYMHSKGMVFNNPKNEKNEFQRNEFEKTTLRGTLYYHERAKYVFENIKFINKVGLWPSEKGFIWVNFFYIRSGYLKVPPIITNDRWWYEEYIGNIGNIGNGNYLDCYSLIKNKVCGIHPDLIKDDQILINQINCNFNFGKVLLDKLHDND